MWFFLTFSIRAQTILVKGSIEGSKGSPIPYTSIINKTLNKGLIADSSGYFQFKATIGDTLLFSSLGYEKTKIVLDNLEGKFYKIILIPQLVPLKEVVVLPSEGQKKRIGIKKNAKVRRNFYFMKTNSFVHTACYEVSSFEMGVVSNIGIKIGYKSEDKESLPVRINFYQKTSSGWPGEKLGNAETILNVNKYSWYHVIPQNPIFVTNKGFCIGVEPLMPLSERKSFDEKNSPIVGVYTSNNAKSFNLANYTKWYELPYKKYACPAVYIEVE